MKQYMLYIFFALTYFSCGNGSNISNSNETSSDNMEYDYKEKPYKSRVSYVYLDQKRK